ncbi:MAG TPA: type VI secretion system ImpA family N-terminal domain-containing protein [Paracoccaceae bacterium]
MMDIDVFLAPLEATNPSGIELRNDVRFHAIERQLEPAARSARLQAVSAGGSGAVDLDWPALLEDARELAGSGRDLRLLVIVARAMTNDAGLDGLADGLTLLGRTIGQYWDSLHPALRDNPSKREAALRRINALYQIENADNGLLGDLEFNTFLNPRGLGPITGGDLAAGGLNRNTFLAESPSGLGEKELAELLARHEVRVSRVTAACRATAAERPEELEALITALARAQAALEALETTLGPLVTENGIGVKFGALAQFLTRISQTLAAAKTGAATPEEPRMAGSAPTPATAAPAAQMANAAVSGHISSRRDVERCLDLIIDFYERTEPSSPIPHLARRMRKMVPMNFMQLMEEIAPSGMKEFRSVAGVFDEKAK